MLHQFNWEEKQKSINLLLEEKESLDKDLHLGFLNHNNENMIQTFQ